MTAEITWRIRTIEGYGMMTHARYFVLEHLANLKDEYGYLWDTLTNAHPDSIKRLLADDCIVRSKNPDGTFAYQITGRGVHALKIFGSPTEQNRKDGICPHCEEKPRDPKLKYCRECYNAMKLQRYHTRPKRYRKPGGICPKCGKNIRHTTPGGTTLSVCLECNREYQREYKRRKTAERRKAQQP